MEQNRQHFYELSLEYVCKLQEIQERKKFEFVEPVSTVAGGSAVAWCGVVPVGSILDFLDAFQGLQSTHMQQDIIDRRGWAHGRDVEESPTHRGAQPHVHSDT